MAQAIAASIKQNLNIDVDVSNKDSKTVHRRHECQAAAGPVRHVSYGFDFLDPYNMLSVLLVAAAATTGRTPSSTTRSRRRPRSPAIRPARREMFQDAERLLVSDVGGVFIDHRTIADVYKPYLKGTELEPDKNGFAAMHWPTYANMSTLVGSLYVSKDRSESQASQLNARNAKARAVSTCWVRVLGHLRHAVVVVFITVSILVFSLMHSVPADRSTRRTPRCRPRPRRTSCASTGSTSPSTSNTCCTCGTRSTATSASRSRARPRPSRT